MSRLKFWLADFCVYTAGASFVKKFIMFSNVPNKKTQRSRDILFTHGIHHSNWNELNALVKPNEYG